MYKIVCFVFGRGSRAVPGMSGLTLEQAQAICCDPETSSRTCKGKAGKARTRRLGGAWFFGYTECGR